MWSENISIIDPCIKCIGKGKIVEYWDTFGLDSNIMISTSWKFHKILIWTVPFKKIIT